MGTTIEATFTFEKATKNTYRYSEDAAEGFEKVGVIYVKKSSLGEDPPRRLKMTIEAA